MSLEIQNIKILQLVDSLDAGGAERMAVNMANAIYEYASFSALMTTRKQGDLLIALEDKVTYKNLNRISFIDIRALYRAHKFLKKHQINLIHAHSSSLFFAVMLKALRPKTKVIWHDHYGDSENVQLRSVLPYQMASLFLNGIIAVNDRLKNWSETHLKVGLITYMPNFIVQQTALKFEKKLKGNKQLNIVCTANFRSVKNHQLLIDVAKEAIKKHPQCGFHLFGLSFNDAYFHQIEQQIEQLSSHIFFYHFEQALFSYLKQSDIGVLTSNSEGLPLAILEYGSCHLAVVSTNVGDIHKVIDDGVSGFLVPKNNVRIFTEQLLKLIESSALRQQFQTALHQKVNAFYSKEVFMQHYQNFLSQIF